MYSEYLNSESPQSDKNLRILLKEIDELNDKDRSNDTIESGIIVNNGLNDGIKSYLGNNKDTALSLIDKINSINTNNLSDESKQNLQNLVKLISDVVNGSKESDERERSDLPFHNLTDMADQSFYKLESFIEGKKDLSSLGEELQNIINFINDDENNVRTLELYIKMLSLPKGTNKTNTEVINHIFSAIRSHFNTPKGLDFETAKKLQINEIFKNVHTKYDLARIHENYIGGTWNGSSLSDKLKIKNKDNSIISYTDFVNKFNEKLKENGIENSDTLDKALGTKENLGTLNFLNPHNFDNDELAIIKTNSEDFYKGYNYTKEEIQAHHHYKKGRIIENIQMHVQNTIKENRDIGKKRIIEKIRSDLVTLPKKEKIEIIEGIHKVVKKFNTIRKYINFKNGPYKDKYPNAKTLLCAMRGITDKKIISNISNNITVRQHGVGLAFFVDDEESYYTIYGHGKRAGVGSGGFNCLDSCISALKGTLSVIKGKDPGDKREDPKYGTILHEGQHNWNSYFMPDKYEGQGRNMAIRRAKDEITAYLRDGKRNRIQIEKCLTKDKKDGGLYQYGLEGNDREVHKKRVKKLLDNAFYLISLTKRKIGLTREKIISMLSDTPRESRGSLKNNIMHTVNNGNSLEDFWRTGVEKKETVINRIKHAKSLEEIKYILRDPKYSHIPRGTYKRGGIEIAAIIDSITPEQNYLSYIPQEIRNIIAKFIKK